MANILDVLSQLGAGGQNTNTDPNGAVPYIADPLAREGYWNWRNQQQERATAQQMADTQRQLANQDNTQPARLAASHLLETLYKYMVEDRYVLQVTGQLPMFQRAINALTQTAADGDTSHITGLDITGLMNEAAKASQRFASMTDGELSAMGWSPETISQYRKDHPAAGSTTETQPQSLNIGETPGAPNSTFGPGVHGAYPAAGGTRLPVDPGLIGGAGGGGQPDSVFGPKLQGSGVSNPGGIYGSDPGTAAYPGVGIGQGQFGGYPSHDTLFGRPDVGPNYLPAGVAGPPNPNMTPEMAQALLGSTLNAPEMRLPGRAAGGPVPAGTPFMTGEHGSEIFMPATFGPTTPPPAPGSAGSATDAQLFHVPAPPQLPADQAWNNSGPSLPLVTFPNQTGITTPMPSMALPPVAAGPDLTPIASPDVPPVTPVDTTAIPVPHTAADAVEQASPGFGDFASQIYKRGLALLDSFQKITPEQAKSLATQLMTNIYTNPAVIAAQADMRNSVDPRFASTPNDTATAQKGYMDALKGATDQATQILNAQLLPYTTVNDTNKKLLDEVNNLGKTVFGSEGVGGAVNNLTTAGVAPGKAQAGNAKDLADAVDTAQKAYQEAPNAENLRRLNDAKAAQAENEGVASRQNAETNWQKMLETDQVDRLTKVSPTTSFLLKNLYHPVMTRTMAGQSQGVSAGARIGGGLLGGLFGGLAAALLGPEAVPGGAAAGAAAGSTLAGHFATHESTREGYTQRTQAFDFGVAAAGLMDPRIHDMVKDQALAHVGETPQPGMGTKLSADAIYGSDYALQDQMQPGWIAQQQKTLTGPNRDIFNQRLRAWRQVQGLVNNGLGDLSSKIPTYRNPQPGATP